MDEATLLRLERLEQAVVSGTEDAYLAAQGPRLNLPVQQQAAASEDNVVTGSVQGIDASSSSNSSSGVLVAKLAQRVEALESAAAHKVLAVKDKADLTVLCVWQRCVSLWGTC